jgi:signal peptide peptidase SppA
MKRAAIDLLSALPDIMALAPSALPKLVAQINLLARGGDGPGPQAVTNARAAAKTRAGSVGSAAVIPIIGPLMSKANWISDILGWSTNAGIKQEVEAAAADDSIGEIILYIDSPGGDVVGLPEAADAVFAARSQKPVLAFVDGLCASAAYFISSQATRLTMLGSGECGSIGAIAIHVDESGANANDGLVVTLMKSSPYKAEFSSLAPLSREAKDFEMTRLMEVHGQFIAAVARGRGVPPATVERDFGQGRVFGSAQAVKVGMVDGIAPSLMEALSQKGSRGRGSASALHSQLTRQLMEANFDMLVDAFKYPEYAAELRAKGWKPSR